jgi:threonine dehydrogenase-like Zn-dependent dehydrogenase
VRALVFTGPGAVELRDVPEPVPAPGEVLVHVRSAGICGSELHGVRHPGFRVPPLIMGHEFAGVSADGDPVVINPILSCGACDLCRTGHRQLCRRRALVGVHRSGGFAERVAVPGSTLRQLPGSMDWDTGALVEPAANAVHAWHLSGATAGARVAVLGCGAIGLLCLLTALAEGAAEVVVTDLSPDRLALAARLGATVPPPLAARLGATVPPPLAARLGAAVPPPPGATVSPTPAPGAAPAGAPGLDGEFDVVFDAVGSLATRTLSVEHLRPGGVAVWLGLAEQQAGFDGNGLVRDEKRIAGSFAYTDSEFAMAMELITGWDLSWATGYPLDAGAEIFTSLLDGASSPVKALLRPPGAVAGPLDSTSTTSGQSTPSHLQNANPHDGMQGGV